jgi:hypothetical protein
MIEQNVADSATHATPHSAYTTSYGQAAMDIPGGPVPLNSPFYIERVAIEQEAFAQLEQPGGLLRLKAPQKMGKSTLMVRLIDRSIQLDYRPLYLDLQLADRAVLADADRFMRWFCAAASRELGLPSQVEAYWSQGLNSKMSCLLYWQHYLLPQIDRPVVLLLNEVNRLFDYPVLAQEFLPFIRSLYEAARYTPILQKLRLVLAYSTEIYVPLQLHQSPFNVGVAIELPELTLQEIHTLVDRYQLPWQFPTRMQRVIRIYELVGGHPYLVQLALHHLAQIVQTHLVQPHATQAHSAQTHSAQDYLNEAPSTQIPSTQIPSTQIPSTQAPSALTHLTPAKPTYLTQAHLPIPPGFTPTTPAPLGAEVFQPLAKNIHAPEPTHPIHPHQTPEESNLPLTDQPSLTDQPPADQLLISNLDAALAQLLEQAPTLQGIYRDHLQRHLAVLRVHSDLVIALQQVLQMGAIELPAAQSYKLQSLGLIRLRGNEAIISRRLYQLYFSRHCLQDPMG